MHRIPICILDSYIRDDRERSFDSVKDKSFAPTSDMIIFSFEIFADSLIQIRIIELFDASAIVLDFLDDVFGNEERTFEQEYTPVDQRKYDDYAPQKFHIDESGYFQKKGLCRTFLSVSVQCGLSYALLTYECLHYHRYRNL